MSRRPDFQLQHQNNVLGIRANEILNDIKTNTASSGSPTTSQLIGNTSADGTGDHNHLHVDGNGVAKTQVINAPTIIPHSELNSGTNDNPRDSLAVGLRARQTITDETTETFLLCDSNGHLQADIANQPNIKLEDLSSSLNAQNVNGTTRSMAVTLKASTDIADVPNNSTFLKCDSSGFLETRDNNKTVIAPNLVTSETTQLQRVYQVLHDVTNNNMRSAKCDGAGSQYVRLDNKTVATGTYAEDTIFPRNYLSLHDVGNQVSRTARCDANGDLVVVNSSINSGSSATLATAQQVLCYGRDSGGNLDALLVDNNGHLKVIVETVENKGSLGNLQNGTLNFGSTSSTVDVSDYNHANFLYEDTNTGAFDSPVIEVSMDNVNFYKHNQQPIVSVRGSKREGQQNYELNGITHIRFKNESVADNFTSCKATIVGTPN